MKTIINFSTVVFLCSVMLSFAPVEKLPIGSALPMPTTKMMTTSGKQTSIKQEALANGVLVMFSCNTCPYVIKNQERTIATITAARQMNIGSIIINSNAGLRSSEDSYKAMQAYAKAQNYKTAYAVDENNLVADAFGATRTPECFLFDKDLKLVYHGAIDDNPTNAAAVSRKHLLVAMTELYTAKPITVTESRSVGCGIKRNK